MEILVERKYKKEAYTIGNLYIDGKWIANTLEDKDRGLTSDMSLSEIQRLKVAGETAIPAGEYNIRMDIISPKYSQKEWYRTNCNGGRLPRVENVKGFDGILMHCGNKAQDSLGCILVGKNDIVGGLSKSREYFIKVYALLYEAYKRGEDLRLVVR